MTPRESKMNHKHWHPKQKGQNHTYVKQTTTKKIMQQKQSESNKL